MTTTRRRLAPATPKRHGAGCICPSCKTERAVLASGLPRIMADRALVRDLIRQALDNPDTRGDVVEMMIGRRECWLLVADHATAVAQSRPAMSRGWSLATRLVSIAGELARGRDGAR